jgi:hypothetical protein
MADSSVKKKENSSIIPEFIPKTAAFPSHSDGKLGACLPVSIYQKWKVRQ